jgi:hypothetical protein
MSEEQDNFRLAVSEWKLRHKVRDDDPMLASVELLELFFQNVKVQVPDSQATFIEVRASIQQLDRLGKDFTKQIRELTQEIRRVPKLSEELKIGRTAGFVITALASLVAGVLIGKFLL